MAPVTAIHSGRAAAGIALVWLCASGLPGCNFFRPETPEAPIGGQSILTNFSEPDSTLATIARAMAAKSSGAPVYRAAFAQSTASDIPGYHHIFYPPDAQAWSAAAGRDPPADWGYEDEQIFFNSFVQSRGEEFAMAWGPDPDNNDPPPGTSTSTIHRHYLVTAVSDDGGATILAVGFADLMFYKGADGNWVMTRWEDRPDPEMSNQKTLGFVRLENHP